MVAGSHISGALTGLSSLAWLSALYNLHSSETTVLKERREANNLQGIDDDTGLSKVLEQQRMATIKAQKEQANKPVKLSTLQCIICMENMKDLTATHCGTSIPLDNLPYKH